ncbi:trypsin [Oesophagostomum dentatum]|uniref:Trypsin n=1 Tax=Oesophagostomum dentatum TaxID=61180 RepID=A0A0B1T663_OESDE|nr:trypsin [Oesophagostomum dentatum]
MNTYLRVDVKNLKKYSVHVGSGCSHPRKCHKQRNVAKVTPHPLYHMDCKKTNDIAIIEFENDISESEATPICTANSTTEVQKILQAAGQGRDRTLKGDQSAKGMQVITVGFEYVSGSQIGTRNATAGIGFGDSGGPLFQFNKNGQAVLLGPCSMIVYYYREKSVCPDSKKLSAAELRKCKS